MSTPALVPPIPQQPSKSLPAQMRAGNSLQIAVQTSLPLGASVFWTLTAIIANVPTRQTIGGAGLSVAADGSVAVTVAAAATASWAPGFYRWVLFAVDSNSDRSELAEGNMTVTPDVAGATPVDPRSRNEKLLANIRNLLQNKALDDAQIYKIGTRELTKMDLPALLRWEGIIENRVRNERLRKSGRPIPIRTVDVVFGGR